MAAEILAKFADWDKFGAKVKELINDGIRFLSDKSPDEFLYEMLLQLASTLVIFLIVRFLIWNKITAILDERKKAAMSAIKERDAAIGEAKKIREDADNTLQSAVNKSRQIIERAKAKGREENAKIIKNAESAAALKLANAQDDIAKMRRESEEQIKNEIVDVAYLMAEKIIAKEIKRDAIDVDKYLAKEEKDAGKN